MNKHYTSGMTMRESRPRSKRLQGLGVVASRTSSATLPWDLTVKSALFDSMFELVGSGTDADPYLIRAKLPLYSDGEITAGGVGSGETPGPATTLGALLNVDSEADDTPTSDKILVREAGATHWAVADLSDISGTVVGVRMNGTVKNPGTDKIVDLGYVATLGTDGKIPSSQLPSYVDDVLEFSSISAFPATGESGKIYIALDTNLTYRWGGSSYVPISQSLALGETASTAYRGDRGKIAYEHSQTTGNPHGTTFANLGGSLTFAKLPNIYIAGTKAKSSASDDALSRVTKISFTAAAAASESVDLEVVTINGQRHLHTSLPFLSDSEITAGGVGSGGEGGGSIVTWTQIQGAQGGVKIATITINGNVIDVYAPAGTTPPTPTDTYVFEQFTPTPISVAASGGAITIKVISTKNGSNLYLDSSGISVPSGITLQSVSTSGDVAATFAVGANAGAARTFTVTIVQPESGDSLTYIISQAAGQVTGEVVDLKGIWSVSDKYQNLYPGYTCYKSNNHTSPSVGKIAITLVGRSSLLMYFRSEAQYNHDGLIANIDEEPVFDRTLYFLSTKLRQNETFPVELEEYHLDSGTHIVYAQYEKDSSGSTQPDEAYIWVPSEIPYINSY